MSKAREDVRLETLCVAPSGDVPHRLRALASAARLGATYDLQIAVHWVWGHPRSFFSEAFCSALTWLEKPPPNHKQLRHSDHLSLGPRKVVSLTEHSAVYLHTGSAFGASFDFDAYHEYVTDEMLVPWMPEPSAEVMNRVASFERFWQVDLRQGTGLCPSPTSILPLEKTPPESHAPQPIVISACDPEAALSAHTHLAQKGFKVISQAPLRTPFDTFVDFTITHRRGRVYGPRSSVFSTLAVAANQDPRCRLTGPTARELYGIGKSHPSDAPLHFHRRTWYAEHGSRPQPPPPPGHRVIPGTKPRRLPSGRVAIIRPSVRDPEALDPQAEIALLSDDEPEAGVSLMTPTFIHRAGAKFP